MATIQPRLVFAIPLSILGCRAGQSQTHSSDKPPPPRNLIRAGAAVRQRGVRADGHLIKD